MIGEREEGKESLIKYKGLGMERVGGGIGRGSSKHMLGALTCCPILFHICFWHLFYH